jgi:hypothetical protein
MGFSFRSRGYVKRTEECWKESRTVSDSRSSRRAAKTREKTAGTTHSHLIRWPDARRCVPTTRRASQTVAGLRGAGLTESFIAELRGRNPSRRYSAPTKAAAIKIAAPTARTITSPATRRFVDSVMAEPSTGSRIVGPDAIEHCVPAHISRKLDRNSRQPERTCSREPQYFTGPSRSRT